MKALRRTLMAGGVPTNASRQTFERLYALRCRTNANRQTYEMLGAGSGRHGGLWPL